jgi:hypothetical protein
MSAPWGCADEVFSIALECWLAAGQRPSMGAVVSRLESLTVPLHNAYDEVDFQDELYRMDLAGGDQLEHSPYTTLTALKHPAHQARSRHGSMRELSDAALAATPAGSPVSPSTLSRLGSLASPSPCGRSALSSVPSSPFPRSGPLPSSPLAHAMSLTATTLFSSYPRTSTDMAASPRRMARSLAEVIEQQADSMC